SITAVLIARPPSVTPAILPRLRAALDSPSERPYNSAAFLHPSPTAGRLILYRALADRAASPPRSAARCCPLPPGHMMSLTGRRDRSAGQPAPPGRRPTGHPTPAGDGLHVRP